MSLSVNWQSEKSKDSYMQDFIISIVNYCQKDLLNRCLTQIKSLDLSDKWHTVVLDNSSSDDSTDMVEANHSWVELIKLNKNVGFGKGHNIIYSKTDSVYFFVLNPDVVVLPGSLEKLVEMLEQHDKAAIVGPKLLNPDETLQLSARRFYNWPTVLCRRLPLPGRKKVNDFHLMKEWDHKNVQNVDWLLGAVMGIRRSAFERNELFDSRYKLYFEDVDLCYFAHQQGWDVLYCPEGKMIHDHQRSSTNGILNMAKINHFLSWLKFYKKSKRW